MIARPTRAAVRLPLFLLAAACSGDAGGWQGTVADSAGITVVHNPASADWTLRDRPRVTEELRIGSVEGAAELQFAQIAALDVDEAGAMYVLDQRAAQVRVFDHEGRFLRSLGRPGSGPGELSPTAAAVLAGDDDQVYVVDVMRQRIAAFAPDGTESGSTSIPMSDGIPIRWEITPDRRFAVQRRTMQMPGGPAVAAGDRIELRDPTRAEAETLLEMESGATFDFAGGAPRMRLFEAEPMWTLLRDGRIARARNDVYRVELLGSDGSVERVLTRPAERRAVTEGDRDAFRRVMRETMSQQGQPPAVVDQILGILDFADFYPAFATMVGGPDGTLWVQHIRTADDVRRGGGTFDAQDLGSPNWDVFDADGRLLGTLALPDRFTPLRFIDEHIYGVQRDDLDVQHVVRLRLDGW